MNSAELDFYVPGPDQKKLREQRLERQREDMSSWRKKGDAPAKDAPKGLSLGPRQRVMEDSELAKTKAEEERRQREAVWSSAAVPHVDRRREWKNNGFEFDRDHFRNSTNPNSRYHSSQKCECSGEHYDAYIHDTITICKPADGKGEATVVTYNKQEARQKELALSSKARSGGGEEEPHTGLCDVLGPDVAGKQRAVDLACQMHEDVRSTQGGKIPTAEVGYVVREGYEHTHDRRQPRDGTEGEFCQSCHSNNNTFLRSSNSVGGAPAPSTTLPAEVKSTRVYTVELQDRVSNKDTGMVRRKSPPRQGIPVELPDSWLNSNENNNH
ncbi:hypothetical protein AGDE_14447 [Angomonas deanei]|uniref:Uncharacterized protein n=1 Tax=Angomonas deanei TaxID=59799 RepID=A0A7G2CQF5_9TRYP|nr:hypothetical protein AGDE_14447 [Angomonas deanei]CAD2221204.1 hypothetical protein, conserved [Angomonas deanei]|eukprot:EPY20844.1 hypothetical protein AGDE_14447 [Angomonas deanei]